MKFFYSPTSTKQTQKETENFKLFGEKIFYFLTQLFDILSSYYFLTNCNFRELSSQKPNSTTLSYPFQYRDSPYINNPVTYPYIHNPVSSMESSCVLLLTIGFFCIILFKWYTFWKNRARLIQQKKWQDGLLRTIEENHESSNAT